MNYSFDNIKFLIKNLNQIVEKSSTGITIRTIHDCAKIISKIYGFSTWKDLKKSLEDKAIKNTKLKVGIIEQPVYREEQVKTVHYHFPKKKEWDYGYQSNLHTYHEIILGKKEIKQLKSFEIKYLTPENFLLISTINKNELFDSIVQQLPQPIIYLQSAIHNTSKAVKPDPWSHIFYQNNLENLLKVEGNDFMIAWINMMRYLYHECSWHPTIEQAMHLLTLKGLAQLNHQAWYLKKYLPDNNYLSEQMQIKHWKDINYAYSVLHSLSELYHKKIFEINSSGVYFGEIAYYPSEVYKQCIFLEVNRLASILAKSDSNFWLVCPDIDSWDNEQTLNKQILKACMSISGDYCAEFEQIVFCKSHIDNLSIQEKMLNETKEWEENIWFNQMSALKNLKSNEAYLWYRVKSAHSMPELNHFYLEKIGVI